MTTGKKITFILIITCFLLAGSWFYYLQNPIVNYLIPGVPYNGIQNLYFQNAYSTRVSSVMDILGYWGDERFGDVNSLNTELQRPSISASVVLKKFFEDNGYQTYYWTSSSSGGELRGIKKFVNADKKIPVIVFQKRWLDAESPAYGSRVVIGIFDKDKKVIVHDSDLGNNYEIFYSDFEAMFTGNLREILAVWPSDKIRNSIKGPDYSVPYPARTEEMNKIGPLLITKLVDADTYRIKLGNAEKAVASYKKLIDDPNFHYLPGAFQVTFLTFFARMHTPLGQYDEAIKIINERVLPLNHDVGEAPKGWLVVPADRLSYPYFILSLAYLKKGELTEAIKYYKEMLVLQDIIHNKIKDNPIFKNNIIFARNSELEKAISSQK